MDSLALADRLPQKPLTALCPSVRGEASRESPPCIMKHWWAESWEVLCRQPQPQCSSWLQWQCHGQKTPFYSTPFQTLAPALSTTPPPYFQMLSKAWGSDIVVLLGTGTPKSLSFQARGNLSVIPSYGICGWPMHTFWYHPTLSVFLSRTLNSAFAFSH